MRKFLPIPFTPKDSVLTLCSIAYALLAFGVICVSDPLVSGVLYVGSVLFGTIALAVVQTRSRCFYTFLFSALLYLGMFVRGVASKHEVGGRWDGDFFIVFGVFLAFLVIMPILIAWLVTFFRKDTNAA